MSIWINQKMKKLLQGHREQESAFVNKGLRDFRDIIHVSVNVLSGFTQTQVGWSNRGTVKNRTLNEPENFFDNIDVDQDRQKSKWWYLFYFICTLFIVDKH